MLKELVLNSRSCRRFASEAPVSLETLTHLVDLARVCPSAGNRQPLRYVLSADAKTNARIFPHLSWASYLTDWPGPAEDERPTGYIVILGDTEVTQAFGCDHGIAAQTIMLGAVEAGLGGCMIGSFKKQELARELGLPSRFEILLVLALGKPKEKVKLEVLSSGDDIKYWRDKQQTHHVPKRALKSIIIELQ